MPLTRLSIFCFVLVALHANAAQELQSTLDDYRVSQDVPGVSAVVVRHDEVVFAGASGLADIASATPMTPDTVLYIGSVTKTLTAILMLQLIETDQLSLDDPVDLLGNETAVSVMSLLTHSSGLPREGNFGYWFTGDFPDDGELREYLQSAPLRELREASARYSNIGYATLGLLAAKLLDQDYNEILQARVLKPLQMNASGGRGPVEGLARGYTPANRVVPSPERPFAGVGNAVGNRYLREYHDARAMSPAFGAYSSANDMGRLLRFLLGDSGDDVLSPAMRARMVEPLSAEWGYGLRIRQIGDRTVARHDGWFAAHRTHLIIDVENEIGVFVMANSDNATPGEIAEVLLDVALAGVPEPENGH